VKYFALLRIMLRRYLDWIVDGSLIRFVLGVMLPTVGILLFITGSILFLFGGFHEGVPTVHLNGACHQYYELISTKGISHYYLVNVCP
jgi:hypothetical protein